MSTKDELLKEKLATLNALLEAEEEEQQSTGIPNQELYIPPVDENFFNPGWDRLRGLTNPNLGKLRGEKK